MEPTYNTVLRAVRMVLLLLSARDQMMPLRRVADHLGLHRRTVKRYVRALSVLSVKGEALMELRHRPHPVEGHLEPWVRLAPLAPGQV